MERAAVLDISLVTSSDYIQIERPKVGDIVVQERVCDLTPRL